MRSEYLMFVSQENNNKFYKMTENGDSFLAEWGRVGAAGQSKVYPLSRWESQLNEKLAKGYTRVVGHGSVDSKTIQSSNLMIVDDDVRELIAFLIRSARQSISHNYLVSSESVTQVQVDEAQSIIGELKDKIYGAGFGVSFDAINRLLEKLYRTIPRKMGNTKDYFLRYPSSQSDAIDLLQKEQSILDTLQSQVGSVQSNNLDLASLGLDISLASQSDKDRISKETDFRVGHQKIFKVTSKDTDSQFLPGKSRLLYHGTRNENLLSVLQRGLLIRPNGVSTTGNMFGWGIYTADKARKSIGYTSLRGSYWASGSSSKAYLALFEVNLGRQWDLLDHQSHSGWMSRLDEKEVTRKGYDSVFARGGADLRNNEYIIYNANRCTIRYLIELNS